MPICPRCGSDHVIKNGHIHTAKPKFACKDCRRQFVENPVWKPISAETKVLIDKLLLERVSLAGIVRVTAVSTQWLQDYVNAKYAAQPLVAAILAQKKRELVLECDELWSFVSSKAEQARLWLAWDADTYLIVGCAIGPRDKETAEELWHSLPPECRQQAVCFTDFYQVYTGVLPSKCHKGVGKETGETAHIERFNNTLQQRCSRLVWKTLSSSKKLSNHIVAIW